jgi:hypothetical protein
VRNSRMRAGPAAIVVSGKGVFDASCTVWCSSVQVDMRLVGCRPCTERYCLK